MSEYAPLVTPENVEASVPDDRGGELVDDPRKTNVFVLIGISAVILAGIIGIYLYFSSSYHKPKEIPLELSSEDEVASEEISTEKSPFSQIKEKSEKKESQEVTIKKLSASFGNDVTPDTKLKKFLSAKSNHFDIFASIIPGETIVRADYSPGSDAVALISHVEENGIKNRARLYLYEADITVNLFEQSVTPIEFMDDPNRVYFIKDIAFSDDGNFLSFVTNYKIFSYDIGENNLTLLLDAESQAVEQNNQNFFFYFSPMYSADNTMLAVGKSYYEGSASFVLDLANNELLNLPFFNYTSGEYINGWLGNKLIVQRHNVDDGNRPNGLFLTTARDPETEQTIYNSSTMPFSQAAVTDDAVYTFFGSIVRYDRITGEQYQVLDVPELWPQYMDETNRFWEVFTDYNDNLYFKFIAEDGFDVYRLDIKGDSVTLHKILL